MKINLRNSLSFFLTFLCLLTGFASTPAFPQDLRSGDLVFLDLDCGELCNAIETVTKEQFQVSGPELSHVGILFEDKTGDDWLVYEAWQGVQVTPLPKVLARVQNDPSRFWIRRMASLDLEKQSRLVDFLDSQLGLPYDDEFLLDNGKYYCSELVAEAFNEALGEEFFEFVPMHYGQPDEAVWKMWDAYFLDIGMAIPQDELGISPLGIFIQSQKD